MSSKNLGSSEPKKTDGRASRRIPPAQNQRLVSLDTVRGLCILSVVSTHFVLLAAPRVAYRRCDALRPLFLDCSWAELFSFLVFNVFAVCILAVLSGISARLRSQSSLGRRGTRFLTLSIGGAVSTSALLALGLIDARLLVNGFAVLPFTNPNQLFFPANDPFAGLGTLFSGQALHLILTGASPDRSFPWPFLWCVPWFLLGWAIIWISQSVPIFAGRLLRIAGAALSLFLPDQGIMACMLAGHAFALNLIQRKALFSSGFLAIGAALAMLPAVRLVPTGLPDPSLPVAVTTTLQVAAAVGVSAGLLGLLQRAGPSIYSALGQKTLVVYALHWPFLLLIVDTLLNTGLHPEWISKLSVALLLFSAASIPLVICLSIRRGKQR